MSSQPTTHDLDALTAPNFHGRDAASGDNDNRLGDLKARLRLVAGGRVDATCDQQAHGADDAARVSARECVAALDQLLARLAQELRRRQYLERQVADAQVALEQVRAELAGIQVREESARHLALHDGLTSLPNRGYFHERLKQAVASVDPPRRELAVLYMDLDGFKPINDLHGHDVGDELLQIVASRLMRSVRAEDMVSRLGGDEFACLLSSLLTRQELCRLACKLFSAVSAPLKIGSVELIVRPSIGIAICPTDGATAEELLRSADAAMYRAKRHRTRYAFFDRHTDQQAGRLVTL